MLDPSKNVYLRHGIPPDIDEAIFTLANFKKADLLYREKGREAGLALLTDPSHASLVTKGSDYSTHQSRNASNPRGKVTDDGKTINMIISELAVSNEHKEEGAKELWPHLFLKLKDEGLDPKEIKHPDNLDKNYYLYDIKDKRKPIRFGTFANVVTKSRKK